MADLRIVDAPLLSTVKGTEKIPTGGEGNFSISVNQVADFAKLKWVLATEGYVDNAVGNIQADLNLHKNSSNNPHGVTKVQVGLGNVDNTADLDKPVSNATQSAIITANSGKADKIYVDQLVINANNSIVNYQTQAALLAFTPTTANYTAKALDTKKVWFWNGAVWVDTGLSEYDLAMKYADSSKLLSLRKQAWLDDYVFENNGITNQAWFISAQKRVKAASAIKHIELINANPSKEYYVSIFCHADQVHKDRIGISDGSATILNSGAVDVVKSTTGLTKVTLKSTSNNIETLIAHLYIDYRELVGLSEVLVTAAVNPLKIAKTSYLSALEERNLTENTPIWIPNARQSNYKTGNVLWQKIGNAIKSIGLDNADPSKEYFISVVAKNDSTYQSRVFISDGTTTVAKYQSTSTTKSGVELLPIEQVGGSGITGSMVVNWSELPDNYGSPVGASSTLYINTKVGDIYALNEKVNTLSKAIKTAYVEPHPKQLRVAAVGSSITWGSGFLGELSYVGILENHLREKLATTLHASDLAPTATTLIANNWYKGSAKRVSGLNKAIEFTLNGNELSLSIGRERGNSGACRVDVYLDDVKYSQFSTFNDLPLNNRTKTFTGNGSQVKFDLEECFTFDHVVTVGGVAKTGSLNTQGSGASIPSSDDFMIVRNYNSALNKVTHVLWFKTAPSGAIQVNYKQGESIAYMRGTLGNIGQGFTTALESAFGDGSVSESTTEPAAISSGLGFRETDDRSVVTFRFDESKTRKIKLVISALDSRATDSTPYLDLNFVTNRMHRIMNAGIGGWSGNLFLTSPVLLNRIDEVANYAPDIMLFESCTNDDWDVHLAKATVTRTGLTNAQVMSAETSNLYNNITGSANAKTVVDERIYITAVTRNTITLEATVTDSNIAAGDAVIIGSYGGNHKRVAVRKVKSYSSTTKTITLDRAISADDFYHCNSLSDLFGDYVLIKNAPTWVQQVKDCVSIVKEANPLCKVSLATCGIPNYNHRRLFGYRELAQKLAGDNGWGFVDFYKATFDFQYSQDQSIAVKTIASTGASEYSLGITSPRMLYNPIVLVNGVEHKQCRILGGYGYQWASNQRNPTLANDVLTDYNYRIVFDKNIPASGATIVVRRASKTWSTDYTHPVNIVSAGQSGRSIFGDTSALTLN